MMKFAKDTVMNRAQGNRTQGGCMAKGCSSAHKSNAALRTCAIALAAILSIGLLACSPQAPDSNSASTGSSAATQDGYELYGSPWVTSVFVGNLPAAAPDASEDLYLHYAYDYAASHQDVSYASALDDSQGELQAAVTAAIKDESLASPELEQLRLFYNQATDTAALEATGAGELEPYLKAIGATQSLDELEKLLLSDDFPFSPWIDTTVSAADMKSTISVAVMPNMLFSDAETGADLYQEADDASAQAAYELMRSQQLLHVKAGLMLLSLADDDDQAAQIATTLFELEQRYGKDEDPNKYLTAEYGAHAEVIKALTPDELAAACPNFPIRETLAKLGEDGGEQVIVMYPEWLASFNDVWTDENFELLRSMTMLKVLRECSAFVDPSFFANVRASMGQGEPTPDEFAYTACDKTTTFSQLLAKTYVEQTLGEQTQEELEQLANDLIDSYIELIGDTPWLNAQTRENVIDKIDNMALNILYPDGGYFDYSELELVPTDKGGTLLGNYLALKAYNDKLEAELVGKPARASAVWLYMRPTAQNCFYDSLSNSINIFPGYITSAVYTKGMSPEELLAGTGFAIGHEISHAFDYSGSQRNAYGEAIAVFSEADVQIFVAKRQEVADYYSTIVMWPDVTVDGTITSAEATADLCGVQVVLKRAESIEGFDHEKLFGSFARKWAVVYAPAYGNLLRINPHPLNNLRVNVNAQMFDEFYQTYEATEGDTMYLSPDKRLAMWGKNS